MTLDVGAEHEEGRRHAVRRRGCRAPPPSPGSGHRRRSARSASSPDAGRRQRMRPSGSNAGMTAERLVDADRERCTASSSSRSHSGAGADTAAPTTAATAASDSAARKIQLRSGAPTPMIVPCTPSGTSSPTSRRIGCRRARPGLCGRGAGALRRQPVHRRRALARIPARARRRRRACLAPTLATLGGIAAGNLTPAPGGEACRIALVRLGGRATWPQATVAAIWDRLSELPPILVLGDDVARSRCASLASRSRSGRRRRCRRRRAGRSSRRSRAWRLRRSAARREPSGARVSRSIASAPRLFGAGVAYSSLLWLQDFLRLTCATLAFGVVLSPTQDRDAVDPRDARRRGAGRWRAGAGRRRSGGGADGVRRRSADGGGRDRARTRRSRTDSAPRPARS